MWVLGSVASPFFAFQQSDLFGRLVVFCLVVISVISWTIILDKWFYLRLIKRQTAEFLDFFNRTSSPLDLFLHIDSLPGPLRNVSTKCMRTIATSLGVAEDEFLGNLKTNRINSTISQVDFELVNCACEEAVDTEIIKMEENLGLLGSIVSSSPFLGLLGTVWGVMMAFCGMALKGKADINAIAPGVSGALLTTVVALMVAIPSLISYNHLTGIVKILTIKFDHFSADLVKRLKKHYYAGDGAA